ncbi:outer membrane lipoprotein-sorting protein [Thiosulfatimonas sediminis]|uniref:Outer membrane lipoprotein-sorting protein n=1 Tax=Thiosulfatimonas sediminis TaxID=2675054 RepID=A0A6F8PRE2_9GAMM|nr:outer membrane lipoprotein-sorting protein [Thiosulfatimonas sediminis]BBP44702.1 outer membrane lipoprotein-sorting protein [Thiosulfatimonas sediminis]
MPWFFSILLMLSLASGTIQAQQKTEQNTEPTAATQPTAAALITLALERWRGKSAYSQLTMLIQRPAWQRKLQIEGWTQGMSNSLMRFTYPPKDSGNAILKIDNQIWLFTPKLQRISKLPNSMLSQSWMGSDFSYNDLAKSDQILRDYNPQIIARHTDTFNPELSVYQLELHPKESAPVVWGKEELWIREDGVLLKEIFFDQQMTPLRALQTLEIRNSKIGAYPTIMRMQDFNKTDEWTEVHTDKIWFDVAIPESLFSLGSLRSPRSWQLERSDDLEPLE